MVTWQKPVKSKFIGFSKTCRWKSMKICNWRFLVMLFQMRDKNFRLKPVMSGNSEITGFSYINSCIMTTNFQIVYAFPVWTGNYRFSQNLDFGIFLRFFRNFKKFEFIQEQESRFTGFSYFRNFLPNSGYHEKRTKSFPVFRAPIFRRKVHLMVTWAA